MQNTELLDPKLDLIFKWQFEAAPELLIDLINAVRSDEPPVVSLEVKNPSILPAELGDKHIILDIWAQDANGQQFDIEMQTSNHAGWNARSVYYLARALGGQLKAGEGYAQIQPVIGIHLLDFDLFCEPEQALWSFELRDRLRPEVVLDRSLQLNLVELPKADRLRTKISPVLAQWITYFKHWREESVMQQIQHPPIQQAYQQLHTLSADELARREAFARERALRGAVTAKAAAFADFLHELLQTKFGALSADTENRLRRASPEQLTQWGKRVLSVQTLDQVFSDH